MGSKKTIANRFTIQPPGELYHDALKVEAWLKRRSMAAEATSLLCSTLIQRKQYREEALAYLAQKRGITPEALLTQILTDTAEILTMEDYATLVEEREAETD